MGREASAEERRPSSGWVAEHPAHAVPEVVRPVPPQERRRDHRNLYAVGAGVLVGLIALLVLSRRRSP